MGDPTVISWFDEFQGSNTYAFLSNFWVGVPISFHGRKYLTGEHLFQAFKARNKHDHDMIAASGTPAEAKANGRHLLRLRPDWERVKYDVMRLTLACKFREGREEKALLLATGDALLVEGNTWGDRVWGVDLKEGRAASERRAQAPGMEWEPGEGWEDAPGRNWLGALLMARRAELYAETRGVRPFNYQDVARFAMEVPKGR